MEKSTNRRCRRLGERGTHDHGTMVGVVAKPREGIANREMRDGADRRALRRNI